MNDIPKADDLGSKETSNCPEHKNMQELRNYVYDHVPKLDIKTGNIWTSISVVTLCGGLMLTLLLTYVNTSHSDMKIEQDEHKKDTSAQIQEMKGMVKTIVESTKAQEVSAYNTSKSVAVFIERYSVMQELTRKEIEELSRRTEHNHLEIQRLIRTTEKNIAPTEGD